MFKICIENIAPTISGGAPNFNPLKVGSKWTVISADHQKYGRKDHGRVDGCKLVDGLLHSGGCVLKHLHTCTQSLNHT